MGKKINQLLRGQVATSVFFLVLGLCLVLVPVGTVNVICKVVFGVLLIATGLYHIVIFLMEREGSTLLNLFSGVIVLVLGGFLFTNPQIVVKLLPVMLGAFILVDSVWTIRGCLKLKKRGLESWKIFLVESLVFIVLGLVLVLFSFQEVHTMLLMAGWTFLCNGVLDIVFFILLRNGMAKEIPEQEDMAGEPEPPREEPPRNFPEGEYEEWKMPSPDEMRETYSFDETRVPTKTDLPAKAGVPARMESPGKTESSTKSEVPARANQPDGAESADQSQRSALPEKNDVEVIPASDVSVEESDSGE